MRLTLLLLIIVGAVCLSVGYGQPLEDDSVKDNNNELSLLSLADQGDQHGNEGAREARAFGYGRGGYGRGGFGYGGFGRGGFGYGGYGRRGFGYGGFGRGGYGYGGFGRGGFGRYGYGR
ncbi:hypothetical protein AWZ03_002783 [Drosophila navojoa]|uniref:Uncharacterized protein n=1 Tax=Drosophila navojoa TaxID=7232 RepID=A0A484BQ44_DRONA|nr:hypothetical protein AWZ03_002783 [Drosophila navojoa]